MEEDWQVRAQDGPFAGPSLLELGHINLGQDLDSVNMTATWTT